MAPKTRTNMGTILSDRLNWLADQMDSEGQRQREMVPLRVTVESLQVFDKLVESYHITRVLLLKLGGR